MAFVPAVIGFAVQNAAAISAAGSIIGGGISAYSAHQQGQAAKAQAEYQARVVRGNAVQTQFDARTNSQNARTAADSAAKEGAEGRRRSLTKSRKAAAKFIANSSRRGLSVGSVSLEDSLRSFQDENNAEAQSISYEAALKGRTFRTQENAFMHGGSRALTLGRSQSKNLRASGQNQARSGTLTAIGQGVSGVTRGIGYLG